MLNAILLQRTCVSYDHLNGICAVIPACWSQQSAAYGSRVRRATTIFLGFKARVTLAMTRAAAPCFASPSMKMGTISASGFRPRTCIRAQVSVDPLSIERRRGGGSTNLRTTIVGGHIRLEGTRASAPRRSAYEPQAIEDIRAGSVLPIRHSLSPMRSSTSNSSCRTTEQKRLQRLPAKADRKRNAN